MKDKTAFAEVFGTSPLIRILDFLMTYREFDYSLTDISKEAEVAWNTLHSLFPKLIEEKIVKETRQVGRAKLYKLNTDNPVVGKLIELNNAITNKAVYEEIERQESETKKQSPIKNT